jgi:hypothetical protein
MNQFINPVGWYDMLTLDHKVCRVCFERRTAANERDPLKGGVAYIRVLAAAEGRPLSDTNLASYYTSLRAWLKRHIAREHPEWTANVRWTKDKRTSRSNPIATPSTRPPGRRPAGLGGKMEPSNTRGDP